MASDLATNTKPAPPQVAKRAGPAARYTAVGAAAAVALLFARPLLELGKLSLGNALYSHIVVVPLISVALVCIRPPLDHSDSRPHRTLGWAFAGAGLATLLASWPAVVFGLPHPLPEDLIVPTLSFLLLLVAACAWSLPRTTLRGLAFPLGLLGFMLPFPAAWANCVESVLQHASAAVAYWFFAVSGMAIYRTDDITFRLPGITLGVAPQCSGLNSSLALLIVSLPAGYLFLRSPWKRALFSLATIPLGIVRNGFRIFTIGELCVRIGPQMIDSYIHHTGGWIFFLLALGPCFLVLWVLVRSDRAHPRPLNL